MNSGNNSTPPIMRQKKYDEPSVFVPENLMREGKRQKSITEGRVHAFDIEHQMIAEIAGKVSLEGLGNVRCLQCDCVAEGTSLADESVDDATLSTSCT